MSTIDNKTITQTVTLGSVNSYPTYASPLTITSTGAVEVSSGIAITGPNGGYIDNAEGRIQGYSDGVYITGGVGTVTNSGTIVSTKYGSDGVLLFAGGSVGNTGTGLIEGNYGGVRITGGAGTVTNSGTIIDTALYGGGFGIYLQEGGSVSNTGTGLIEGEHVGVYINSGAGAVTNSGTIISTARYGVYLRAGGSVGNTGTGLIEGKYFGVRIGNGAGTVTNSATIIGTASDGVYLVQGGSVVNMGLIEGNFLGVHVYGGAGTVSNSGTIIGTADDGVYFAHGGSVDNTGLIEGNSLGLDIYGGAGTVSNSGTIIGTNIYGVLIAGGSVGNTGLIQGSSVGVQIYGSAGTVTNTGTISGTSGYGIELLAGGTVVDSGTVSGATATAISFGGGGGNLLALEHGYALGGAITVAGTANTLELLGTAGAVVGDFDKAGAGFINFSTIAFGAASGNDEIIKISDTTALPGTISSFSAVHDIVDLTQLNPVGAHATLGAGNLLVVSNGSQSVSLQLDSGDYSSVVWQTSPDSGSGTDITPACFCRGTLILTDAGEVPVEELELGDRVVTISGEAKPIRWIGRRGYDGRFVAGNRAVLPIQVIPGALSDGVPARELRVSPEHALYLDGTLVPAGLLVNGASIVQIENVDQVEYFHIEFAGHEVIFADGAPAESFIDDDSRRVFHNAAEFPALYPDAPPRVSASFCAPRIEEGVALEALRCRLLGRARRLAADARARPAVLRGCIELVDRARIGGWAFDPTAPDTPVGLVVLTNGAEIGRVVADRYRRDLDEAGIGDGHHAFELVVLGGLAADVRHEIEVRSDANWSPLRGSPAVLEPVAPDLDREQRRPSAAASTSLGALRGKLDTFDRMQITGWAQDDADPERRVGLVVKVNDQVIGRVLANRYRGDLEADGIGDGRHSFELLVPAISGLTVLEAWRIQVQREADGAELPGSPLTLPAANGFDLTVEQNFAGILARVTADADEDRALSFLTEQANRLLARRAERHGGRAEREAHRRFRRRWGPQEADALESLRPPHLRALVVDQQVPCATRDAGSVAILSHVRALRGLGYEVVFAASDDMGNATALTRFAEVEGIATCGLPHYSCVEDVLYRQAGTFDLVYLHRAESADRYLSLVRRYCPKARILYSVADLHHLRVARQAQVERRPELLAHSRYLAVIEMMAARRADIVVTHSPVEAEMLRREVGFGKVHVVPFAVATRQPRRPFAERHGLAILGSFGHAPNPDAVHYLIRDILPRVWAGDPTLTCKIIGHGWHAGRLPRLDPRIEMIGEVADLDVVFDTVRLTVAPLRFGAGIKGKALDSFAAGLPCVMTPIAAEGLALTGALPQLVGDDTDRLAELVLRFHADRIANEQAGIEGARMVARHFSTECVSDALHQILHTASSSQVSDDYPSGDSAKMASVA